MLVPSSRWSIPVAVLAAVAVVVAASLALSRPHGQPSLVDQVSEGTRLSAAADALSTDQPQYAAPLPRPSLRGVSLPWRVGIQAGHWKVEELPDEEYRLRGDTGAQWGSVREVDVNLRIAHSVASQLEAAGIQVDLLPATVPSSYDGDAFVAIHADYGGRDLSGFKVSTPWRASRASKVLSDSVAETYGQVTGLPVDRYGISYNMRGYYAFSYYRFEHAVAPSTPCMIIETGFLTSASDRQVIVDNPDLAARGIAEGIITYLGERSTMKATDLVPLVYAPLEVATDQAALRYYPQDGERVMGRLAAGTLVRVFDEQDGWAELMVFGHFRLQGWMRLSDLRGVTDFYGGTTKASGSQSAKSS